MLNAHDDRQAVHMERAPAFHLFDGGERIFSLIETSQDQFLADTRIIFGEEIPRHDVLVMHDPNTKRGVIRATPFEALFEQMRALKAVLDTHEPGTWKIGYPEKGTGNNYVLSCVNSELIKNPEKLTDALDKAFSP